MPRKTKEVNPIYWQQMAGDTPLEQMINAYLTTQFITKYRVPADECLAEADKIIQIVRAYGDSGDSGAAWDALGRAEFPEYAERACIPNDETK